MNLQLFVFILTLMWCYW